jgi:hypothetical protein
MSTNSVGRHIYNLVDSAAIYIPNNFHNHLQHAHSKGDSDQDARNGAERYRSGRVRWLRRARPVLRLVRRPALALGVPVDDEFDHLLVVGLDVHAVGGEVGSAGDVAVWVAGVAVGSDAVAEGVAGFVVGAVEDLPGALVYMVNCEWASIRAEGKTYTAVTTGAVVVRGVGLMCRVAEENDGNDWVLVSGMDHQGDVSLRYYGLLFLVYSSSTASPMDRMSAGFGELSAMTAIAAHTSGMPQRVLVVICAPCF